MKKLRFDQLSERHPIDPAQLQGYANAAKVRLEAHHQPPVSFEICTRGETALFEVVWTPVEDIMRRSYNNQDDAVRDGAYVMALAAVEEVEGLVAVGRAETKTGADYYVAPFGTVPEDFEDSLRLEVSGIDKGTAAACRTRLEQKREQARKGSGTEPALAAVVGFKQQLILVERA
jgi:hypothetical protein